MFEDEELELEIEEETELGDEELEISDEDEIEMVADDDSEIEIEEDTNEDLELSDDVTEEQKNEVKDLANEFGLDEFDAVLKGELEKIEEESTLSDDLEAYANGFPNWDLVPPNK